MILLSGKTATPVGYSKPSAITLTAEALSSAYGEGKRIVVSEGVFIIVNALIITTVIQITMTTYLFIIFYLMTYKLSYSQYKILFYNKF
jgi:hypothetical protein